MSMRIFLFSYNRGAFLENCLRSIRNNAPALPLTIIDDNSDDPDTCARLQAYSEQFDVRILQHTHKGRYGGLYANMQYAFEDMGEADKFLFIQDDSQLVRLLRPEDITYIDAYFSQFREAAFVNPVFLRGIRRQRITRTLHLDPDFPIYFYSKHEKWRDRSVSMYFSDIVIGHVPRLKAAGWSFVEGEASNARKARTLFSKMGLMLNPLVMHVPEVPAFHGKKKTWAMARAERLAGTDPAAFATLEGTQLDRLLQRAPSALPFAEDFLQCPTRKSCGLFQPRAVHHYPFLRLCHKIEAAAQRFWPRNG